MAAFQLLFKSHDNKQNMVPHRTRRENAPDASTLVTTGEAWFPIELRGTMLQLLLISDGNRQSMISHCTNKDNALVFVQLSVVPSVVPNSEHFCHAAAVVHLS